MRGIRQADMPSKDVSNVHWSIISSSSLCPRHYGPESVQNSALRLPSQQVAVGLP